MLGRGERRTERERERERDIFNDCLQPSDPQESAARFTVPPRLFFFRSRPLGHGKSYHQDYPLPRFLPLDFVSSSPPPPPPTFPPPPPPAIYLYLYCCLRFAFPFYTRHSNPSTKNISRLK
jgi:hypothetical protein